MIINSLKLQNIRSYLDETITFPQGSVLLSGDIGSGKTTLLLAIEFAIFGFIKGQVSGTSLLRHGKKQGFVELDFTLNNKNIIIRRNLKRGPTIKQEAGHIIIDGVKTEATAVELKSRILELLGYPEELLTKSKSLIFRYTVYTPQEEMKHILYEKPDERLDTLRKIFNIEKYKRIKENTVLCMRELKIQRTRFETRIEGLEELKEESKKLDAKIKDLDKKIKNLDAKIKQLLEEKNTKKKLVEESENKIKEFNELKKQVQVLKVQIENSSSNSKEKEKQLKELQEELAKEPVKFDEKKLKTLEAKKKACKLEIDNCEKKLKELDKTETEYTVTIKRSKELIDKISGMDKCPTCTQKVTEDHVKMVKKKHGDNIKVLEANQIKLEKIRAKYKKKLEDNQGNLEKLDKELKELEINKVKAENLATKKKQTEKLKQEIIVLERKTAELKKENEKKEKELSTYKDLDDKYSKAKQAFDLILKKEKELEVEKASYSSEKQALEEHGKRYEKDIKEKQEAKQKLEKAKQALNWFNKYLMNIVSLMEKQILLKLHQEFNSYFCQWFDTLIEEENLDVRLDEDFSPVIVQNGYETYLENLSGGEKTSLALSYRLALNKVINDFVGNIQTKDLIILDEPTDGFSTEQLDRIRDVIEQLNMKQIILVSHEPKLESYVDNIIRIVKEHHVSKALA